MVPLIIIKVYPGIDFAVDPGEGNKLVVTKE